MLTQKDVDKLVKVMEKKFATKDDLANFATKDDLANFATKDDLANFESKMTIEFLNLEERISTKIENYHDEIIIFKDGINTKLDNQAEVLEILNQERLVENEVDKRTQRVLERHDEIIKTIKKHLKIV